MPIALFESLCKLCKHRKGLCCEAFPEGIPLEIREMRVDHRQPYPGDQGIRFETIDQSDETRRLLESVRVRTGRVPAGTNDLDRRISRIWKGISFPDANQRSRFTRLASAASRFEELPEWCQALVLRAEASELPEETTETEGEPLVEVHWKTAQ